MTTDILPDILARAITDSVKRAGADTPDSAVEARNLAVLARHCEYMLQEARVVEAEVKELVKHVVEAGFLRRRCEAKLESINQDLNAAGDVLQLADRVASSKQSDPGVALSTQIVGKVRQELLKIQEVFLGYMEVLNRPLPADFWEKASAAAASGGPYIRVDKYEDLFGDAKD